MYFDKALSVFCGDPESVRFFLFDCRPNMILVALQSHHVEVKIETNERNNLKELVFSVISTASRIFNPFITKRWRDLEITIRDFRNKIRDKQWCNIRD